MTGRIKATRAESQWIVAAKAHYALQYPSRVFKVKYTKDSTRRSRWGASKKASPWRANPARRGSVTTCAPGARPPTALDRQAGHGRGRHSVASLARFDLEALIHNPTPYGNRRPCGHFSSQRDDQFMRQNQQFLLVLRLNYYCDTLSIVMGKTNFVSTAGLNPKPGLTFPHWWVNNPTLTGGITASQ
ncbi:hypothetical protein HKD37_U058430 [Glycine soja]